MFCVIHFTTTETRQTSKSQVEELSRCQSQKNREWKKQRTHKTVANAFSRARSTDHGKHLSERKIAVRFSWCEVGYMQNPHWKNGLRYIHYFLHSTSSFSKVSPTNRPKFNARADVAERLERIAALKKRLGIYTSAKKPSASVLSSSDKRSFFSDRTGIGLEKQGTQRAFVDDSDDDYWERNKIV